jgi:hypothetical protein
MGAPLDDGMGEPGGGGKDGLAAGIGPSAEFISKTNSNQSLALKRKKEIQRLGLG